MVLHTINKTGPVLELALSSCSEGDAILLIEDGVYAAMRTNTSTWNALLTGVKCFALKDDLAVRGISDKMLPLFTTADWQEFVSLTLDYDKVVSWG